MTGGAVWKIIVHNWRKGFTLTAAPLYYNSAATASSPEKALVYVGIDWRRVHEPRQRLRLPRERRQPGVPLLYGPGAG